MTEINQENERQRLIGLYSGMTSEQLQQLSQEQASLTDIARQTLSTEIARRNLPTLNPDDFAPESEPELDSNPTDEIELLDLVVLRQFRDLPEAIMARGVLESAGIESFLGDENIVRMDWFISNLVGGIKLKVRREEVEAANLILDTPSVLSEEQEGEG